MSVGTQNQKKLECLLNDWLDANWRQEYVQGMLALAGVVVMTVEKREDRRDVLYILCVVFCTPSPNPRLSTTTTHHCACRRRRGGRCLAAPSTASFSSSTPPRCSATCSQSRWRQSCTCGTGSRSCSWACFRCSRAA